VRAIDFEREILFQSRGWFAGQNGRQAHFRISIKDIVIPPDHRFFLDDVPILLLLYCLFDSHKKRVPVVFAMNGGGGLFVVLT
jgi:hypothetical protein